MLCDFYGTTLEINWSEILGVVFIKLMLKREIERVVASSWYLLFKRFLIPGILISLLFGVKWPFVPHIYKSSCFKVLSSYCQIRMKARKACVFQNTQVL